jgi:hypothetical protein
VARSARLTAVAVLVLICSGIVLAAGIFALAAAVPGADRTVSILMAVAAVWGMTTAVGILLRRRWARISILTFSAFLALVGCNLAPFVLFMRLPIPPGATETGGVIPCVFCLLLIAVGLWWARLFSTTSAKELFGVSIPANSMPFSIGIIAWYLVVNAALGAANLLRTRNHLPTSMFGFVFTGWRAVAISIAFITIDLYLGFSLLRRRQKSPRLVGYYCLFELLDISISLLRPGWSSRVRIFYDAQLVRYPALAAHFSATSWLHFTELVTLEETALTLLALWFLAVHKNAFAVDHES